MDLKQLHEYYLINGIRKAAKLAKTRISTLQKMFNDAGYPIRTKHSPDFDTAMVWHQRYMSGESFTDLELSLNISGRALKRIFESFNFPLKTKEQVQAEKSEKIKSTVRKLHNVDNVMQIPEVVEKLKKTMQEKPASELKATDTKRKATIREKHNTDYYVLTEEFRLKTIDTLLAKHGVDRPSKSPAIIAKRIKTRHERRGSRLEFILGAQGYTLLEQYVGNRITVAGKHYSWRPYRVRHSCGTEFQDDVYMLPRCPKCFPLNRSKDEIELEQWLLSLGYEVEHSSRKLIVNPASGRGFELDITIPKNKIAIEYNGSFYHAGRNDHWLKTDLCLEAGYNLYHVWDYNDKTNVQSRLSTVLGLNTRIFARNTETKELDLATAAEFTKLYHMHGHTLASYAFGLYHDDQLVSVLTLRKNITGVLEIARFCSKHYTQVIGGFGKLLARVRVSFTEPIITYADRDWCPDWRASVYAKSGFKFVGDSGPILRYVNTRTLEVSSRERYQRYKLKELFPALYDDNITAHEILLKANIVPIWNSGNFKFTLP